MREIYLTRDIEKSCPRDINFRFLLEGASATNHSTFARFRSLHFSQCSEKMEQMSNFFYKIGEVQKML